jgi:DNA invertase Pin-like site-specific DNA recombinase
VAQFEREIITERVNAGIAAARQRGVRLGRPSRVSHHAPAVAAMLAEGFTASEIARKLGVPYSTTSEMVRELRGPLLASSPSQASLLSPALLFSQPSEL